MMIPFRCFSTGLYPGDTVVVVPSVVSMVIRLPKRIFTYGSKEKNALSFAKEGVSKYLECLCLQVELTLSVPEATEGYF